MPPESTAGSPPFRARLSLFRQRVILTIRWWFRLPIDEYKEKQTQAQLDQLFELNKQALKSLQMSLSLMRRLSGQLQYYEKHIPRMRDLKRQYEREQAILAQSSPASSQALDDGILEFHPVGAMNQ